MDRAVPFARIAHLITPHFVTRQIFTGAGKVGSETPGARGARHRVPDLAALRVLRGGDRPGDHAQAADREHPRRAPRRSPALPPPARHRGRRQPGRGGHLLEDGDDRPGAGAHRGRRLRRGRAGPGQSGPGHPPGVLDPTLSTASRWPTAGRSPRSPCSGSCSAWPASTPRTGAWPAWAARRWVRWCSSAGRRSCTASRPIRRRWPARSTGRPSSSCWRPTASATACDWDDSRLAAVDLQYHDLRPERSLFARLDTERLVDEDVVRGGDRAAPAAPGPTSGASA